MKPEILKDLQEYIDEHLKMQLICFNLSDTCDKLGYPGFKHFFQVQSQDEMLHQRRIMNYITDRDESYTMSGVQVKRQEFTNIIDILNEYVRLRKHFAKISDDFSANALKVNDFQTAKFYEWFIIDFFEEISETNDLIAWLEMSNGNHYDIDKRVAKRSEPDTAAVIDPFAPHS